MFRYLLLLSFLCPNSVYMQSSWFEPVTGNENWTCTCDAVDGVTCTIGDNTHGRFNCTELTLDTPKFSLTCQKYRLQPQVRLHSLMQVIPNVLYLDIDGCNIDFSTYAVVREKSSYKTRVFMVPKLGKGSRCAFKMKPKLQLRRNSTNLNPLCGLMHLKISNAFLRFIPIGFLETCNSLKILELTNNDLTIISDVDFVSLISLPRLEILRLSNNSISTITTMFVDNLLEKIRKFFTYELADWVKEYNETLAPSEVSTLNRVAEKFSGWPNRSYYPFSFQYLTAIVRKYKPPIDFELDNTIITTVDLSNNKFKQFPIAMFGMHQMHRLHLSNNDMSEAFTTSYSFTFFSVGRYVIHLEMSNNNILKIDPNSLEFLGQILYLDLSYNLISWWPPDAIIENMRLRKLNLDRNNIREIRLQYRLPKLSDLSVAYNRIRTLGRLLTDFIPKIQFLNISHNPFEAVEPFAISKLVALYTLDLSHGKINKMLAQSYFIGKSVDNSRRPTVKILYNRGNLLCDCNSVFSAIKRQHHTDHGYEYPWIVWSKNQTCGMGGKMPTVKLLQLNESFLCHATGVYCTQDCRCCLDINPCRCRFHCPSRCECQFEYKMYRPKIDCSNRGLTYIPSGDTRASILRLNGNLIKSIAPNAFPQGSETLASLYLNNNSLALLGKDAFKQLVSLRFLQLSNNKIHRISSKAFANLKAVDIIRLENNSLTTFKRSVFLSLSNLSQLFLRDNPLTCDCHHLPTFLKFKRTGGNSGSLYIEMPDFCRVPAEMKRYGGVKTDKVEVIRITRICLDVALNKDKERKLIQQRLIYGLTSGLSALALLLTVVIAFRHRYNVRVYMDKRVKSTLARTILSLTTYNMRAGIDVGFLVHERQTEHFYAIRRRLTGTPRQALNIVRIADHMPGSTRLGQVAHLASDMAVCVVLISRDLIQDSLFMEALRILLVHNLERNGNSPRMSIVPILLSDDVRETDEWPNLDIMLRHYPILHWNQSFFWERLLTSLPPPPPSQPESLEAALPDDEYPLMSREEADDMVHMCLIAHENQSSQHVRDMFDRYRSSLSLCHVRHNRLYGSFGKIPANQSFSLNYVLGNSLQIAVLVSLEFLHDRWTRQQVFPSLTARLQALPFRGTIILLETGPNFANLCQDENFRFFDEVRRNPLVVTLAWSDVERNWEVLNAHLLPESVPREELDSTVSGMDETEYVRYLMTPVANLDGSDGNECNIFEQHQARWTNYEAENMTD